MSDAIQEKVMLAKKWCEDTEMTAVLQGSVENESTYCESGAVITGSVKKADEADKELQKAVKAGSPAEAFKNAPLNGCLSVMTMARTKAGFDPTDIEDQNAAAKFVQYSKNLQSAPFFHLVSSDVSHLDRQEKSWDKLINNVLDLYEGVSNADKDSIRKSLGNIASAAMNKAGTKQTKNLFVQSEINYTEEIEVFVFWARIEMTYESGKSTSTQETVDISKLKLQFDKTMWPYYAEMVLKYNISFIEEWLKQNAVSQDNNAYKKVCFCKNLADQ